MKRQSQLQQISKTLLVSRIDKSGSLIKLQQVMGYSSLQVSLTLLQGKNSNHLF